MTVLAIVQSWYVLGTTKCVFDRYIVIFVVTRKTGGQLMIQFGCQVYILLAVYQEESIFMLLILFDPMSIFICSTDRICICLKKLAVLTQFLFSRVFRYCKASRLQNL